MTQIEDILNDINDEDLSEEIFEKDLLEKLILIEDSNNNDRQIESVDWSDLF